MKIQIVAAQKNFPSACLDPIQMKEVNELEGAVPM